MSIEDDTEQPEESVFCQVQSLFGHLMESKLQYYIPENFWKVRRVLTGSTPADFEYNCLFVPEATALPFVLVLNLVKVCVSSPTRDPGGF